LPITTPDAQGATLVTLGGLRVFFDGNPAPISTISLDSG
jgi:hypothetical protein